MAVQSLKERLGPRLRELRGARSQFRVAADSGVSMTFYNRLERGVAMPSLEIAEKLARYHGVSLTELTEGK